MRLLIGGAIVVLFLLAIYWREFSETKEGFEDKKDDFTEAEAKLHDKVFDNKELINHDIEMIAKKVVKDKSYDGLKILDAGCGVGNHYKEIVKTFKGADVTGVDRSNNMLKQARIKNPGGDFMKGDLLNADLFPADSFDYIFSMMDTLYHNQDYEKIIKNYQLWLKPDGLLCIHIFDADKLDPGAQSHTQYYLDSSERKHGITYYDGFAHDAYWEKKDDCIDYIQQYILENGLKKTKKTKMFFPTKGKLIKTIQKSGFKLVDIMSLEKLHIEDIELFCFKKV